MVYGSQPGVVPCLVPVAEVTLDPEFQVRLKMNPGTVETYRSVYRSGRSLPPVALARHKGSLLLVDGWHRFQALTDLGRTEVEATIAPVETLEEARWLAASANIGHGLQLKRSEHREVFRAYIKAGGHKGPKRRLKSYRDIAADLGGIRGRSTLHSWMTADFPQIAKLMSRDEPLGPANAREEAPDQQEKLWATTSYALATLVSAAPGLTDEDRRGELIAALETALADLKSKPYRLPPPPDF